METTSPTCATRIVTVPQIACPSQGRRWVTSYASASIEGPWDEILYQICRLCCSRRHDQPNAGGQEVGTDRRTDYPNEGATMNGRRLFALFSFAFLNATWAHASKKLPASDKARHVVIRQMADDLSRGHNPQNHPSNEQQSLTDKLKNRLGS